MLIQTDLKNHLYLFWFGNHGNLSIWEVCASECTFYSNRIGNELVLAVVVLGVCGRFSFYFFISFSFSFWVVVMIATCNVYIIRCVSGCPECLPAIRRRYTLSRRQMYKAVAAVIVLVNVHWEIDTYNRTFCWSLCFTAAKEFRGRCQIEGRWQCTPIFKVAHPQLWTCKLPFWIGSFLYVCVCIWKSSG